MSEPTSPTPPYAFDEGVTALLLEMRKTRSDSPDDGDLVVYGLEWDQTVRLAKALCNHTPHPALYAIANTMVTSAQSGLLTHRRNRVAMQLGVSARTVMRLEDEGAAMLNRILLEHQNSTASEFLARAIQQIDYASTAHNRAQGTAEEQKLIARARAAALKALEGLT